MKRKIAVLLAVLCLAVAFDPGVSHAAITPAFVAVNDTFLPFSEEYMPFVVGGQIFMPVNVFAELSIYPIGDAEEERVLLYKGARYLDFSTRSGQSETRDQDRNLLAWPHARRIGNRFYVPLRQVADFFGLTIELHETSRDIIPQQQVLVVRIVSSRSLNIQSLIGLNRNALRTAYNEYYAPPSPMPGEDEPPPPVEEPPDYSSILIHLSFYDISAGSAEWILDMLDIQAAFGYHSCFFVNARDIFYDPGLIRRISGAGHSLGIWLEEGTYEEYMSTSALLFEAVKIRTVLVSGTEEAHSVMAEGEKNGLILWASSHNHGFYDDLSAPEINDMIPREDGARYSLMFSCSENAVSELPGVISFLRNYGFALERITETVEAMQLTTDN